MTSPARTANCPNCGAEIVFRWSGAVQTTCPACKAILVRHDVDLEKVGQAADVPAAMSRIQIGTEGRSHGTPFVVVGRIAYQYGRGHWSEWHLRLSDDSSAWLSDAQGDYVFTRQVPMQVQPLPVEQIRAGETLVVNGTPYEVATITDAAYAGVEGELPFEYWDKTAVTFVDLTRGAGGFATIDYSEEPPLLFVGGYESFESLGLSNLREPETAAADAVKARSFSCAPCGAPVELRTGELAQVIACAACGAIMDATDPNLKVLQREQKLFRARGKPRIPLGSTGAFKGVTWTVVGYQVRGITVEDIEYDWREYLLWNADAGFRYLTEYDGHWNDVITVRGAPKQTGSAGPVEHVGRIFKHFQHAVATTRLVVGEFPWEARAGDRVNSDDFIAPPLLLSREATKEEVTWSLGTYVEPERIRQAFRLKEPLPRPRGVFANQPNPMAGLARSYGTVFLALCGLLLGLFLFRRMTAANEPVFADSYRWASAAPFVTRVFELRRSGNVEIRINTDLSNDWAFFNLALLSEGGGRGYELGREVSYYFGRDGGESWSEGGQGDRAMLANVPAGRYYLRVETERDTRARPFTYELLVRRDVPRTWPFLVALLLLALPPVFAGLRERSFEYTRWQESDYAVEDDDEE